MQFISNLVIFIVRVTYCLIDVYLYFLFFNEITYLRGTVYDQWGYNNESYLLNSPF
jgi:hypothetical protein